MKAMYAAFAILAMTSSIAVANDQSRSEAIDFDTSSLLAREGGGANGSERTPGAIRSEQIREKQIKIELEKQKAEKEAKA